MVTVQTILLEHDFGSGWRSLAAATAALVVATSYVAGAGGAAAAVSSAGGVAPGHGGPPADRPEGHRPGPDPVSGPGGSGDPVAAGPRPSAPARTPPTVRVDGRGTLTRAGTVATVTNPNQIYLSKCLGSLGQPRGSHRYARNQGVCVSGDVDLNGDEVLLPQGEVYVVENADWERGDAVAGDVTAGGSNTVAARLRGGQFFDKPVWLPAPSLTPGEYDVVLDDDADGVFEPGVDAVIGRGPEPGLVVVDDISDHGLSQSTVRDIKDGALSQSRRLRSFNQFVSRAIAASEARQAVAGIEGVTTAALSGELLTEALSVAIKQGTGAPVITGPRDFLLWHEDAFLAQTQRKMTNYTKPLADQYDDLAADPPDPDFRKPVALDVEAVRPNATPSAGPDRRYPFTPRGPTEVEARAATVANRLAEQAAIVRALRRSREKFQGARAANSVKWAVVHAGAVRRYGAMLESNTVETRRALRAYERALRDAGRTGGVDASAFETLRERVRSDGFSRAQLRAFETLGLSSSEIRKLERDVATASLPDESYTRADRIDALVAGMNATLPAVGNLTADAARLERAIEADAAAIPEPAADAGGPYAGTAGDAVGFDATNSTDDASLTYAWDTDLDGEFDDAAGPTPSVTFDRPRDTLVGVKVTDPEGLTDVDYAPLSVALGNRPPTVVDVSPANASVAAVVGESVAFGVSATDPDGDPLAYDWFVGAGSVGEGANVTWTPTADDVGPRAVRVRVSDTDPHSPPRFVQRTVLVRFPDADGDGYRADDDCDDADSAVNPGRDEVEDNGLDDDCDPLTLDSGGRRSLGPATGTEYVTFWSQTLRVVAHENDTRVWLYDVDTGEPVSFRDDDRVNADATSAATNPFVLDANRTFEGVSVNRRQDVSDELRIRVVTEDAAGNDSKPVTVWTGSLADSTADPDGTDPPPDGNPWMSYVPAFDENSTSTGRELGRHFRGFTTRDAYLFVENRSVETRVTVADLGYRDGDTDDTRTLTPGSDALAYSDDGIEVYELHDFEDDAVYVESNADASVLVGYSPRQSVDWTVTPPSHRARDDGFELGTTFYAFVHRSLAVFPTRDGTTVTVTDLSDGDDDATVTLRNGTPAGAYDVFVPDVDPDYLQRGSPVAPRPSSPSVTLRATGDGFDDDLVRVETSEPAVLHVGPVGSHLLEFADVAYSIPTGPASRLAYAYVQNGGSNDLQLFGFNASTEVGITSLTTTDGFRGGHHDFAVGPGVDASAWATGTTTGPWKRGTPDGDVWWGSDVWGGELLRIESTRPVMVLSGDYEKPHFGAFVPFVREAPRMAPVAKASVAGDATVGVGETVVLDGRGSFDQDAVEGNGTPAYRWDLDAGFDADGDGDPRNDVDAAGATANRSYAVAGAKEVTLTYVDDDGQADTTAAVVRVTDRNEAPTVETGPDRTVTEEEGVALAAVVADPDAGDAPTATVDWGGVGRPEALPVAGNGTASATHRYGDDGEYAVEACATDGRATACSTFAVTVENSAPEVTAGPDREVREGAVVELGPATFTDRGVRDTHTATVDWADGDGPGAALVSETGPRGAVSGTHLYRDDGTREVAVTVADDDGARSTDVVRLAVVNVAPNATLGVNRSGGLSLPGGDGPVYLAGAGDRVRARVEATDPGADVLTVDWRSGPATTHDATDGALPVSAAAATTVAPDGPGVTPVAATVADDDGGSDVARAALVVRVDGPCAGTADAWRHVFGGQGDGAYDASQRAALVAIAARGSAAFSGDGPADAAAVLGGDGPRGEARARLLAAWLNFGAGAVDWDEAVRSGETFGEAVVAVEETLADPDATRAELDRAGETAAALNRGVVDRGDDAACGQRGGWLAVLLAVVLAVLFAVLATRCWRYGVSDCDDERDCPD